MLGQKAVISTANVFLSPESALNLRKVNVSFSIYSVQFLIVKAVVQLAIIFR